jgi:pimeloyl-ACP methyl ester carboxylesterase
VAGCGYGSGTHREQFTKDSADLARRLETEGMEKVAQTYTRGPARVQFLRKDPTGWQEFRDRFGAQSARGHALTMRGVQLGRPSVFDLEERLARLTVPTLIVTGDEDEPCLEPGIFMKRKVRSAGLLVIPNSGHTINLEEPDLFNRALLDFLTAVDSGRWPTRSA